MAIRVLIADEHELFRRGLKQLLLDELSASEVLEAESFEETQEVLTDRGPRELVLVDLRMLGMSGAEPLGKLRDDFAETKFVVVSASEERVDIFAALDAGAHGYILKSLSADEIAAALKSVLAGRIFVPSVICRRDPMGARSPLPPQGAGGITWRQRQVLKELLSGRTSKEIARTLGISEATIKVHLAAIYRALGVRSRAEAIAKYRAGRLA